jgi:hypothetical protein
MVFFGFLIFFYDESDELSGIPGLVMMKVNGFIQKLTVTT